MRVLPSIALLLAVGCRCGAFVPLPRRHHYPSPAAAAAAVASWTRWGTSTAASSTSSSTTPASSFAHASSSSSEAPPEWRGQVLGQLRTIIDPDLGSDIVALGFVQQLELLEGNVVSLSVELTTPACPVKDQFAADCEARVRELAWVGDVRVTMTAQDPTAGGEGGSGAPSGMARVGAVVAVSSCKGGVGKSTTAVNLAFALQGLGAAVGLFDADLYGPSLPTMVTPDDDAVRFVGRQIAPLQRNGVRLMSFGYVNDGAAVMRGPMVTQLLDQFLSITSWGKLDYLVLDMPPGTGDIQLTLTQKLNITAAVIVTTPQELSFADVVRGVEMFDSVNVPSVAVVENMAYYEQKPVDIDTEKLKRAVVDKLLLLDNKSRQQEQEQAGWEQNGSGSSPRSSAAVDALADELVETVVQQLQSQQGGSSSKRVEIFGPGHKHRLSQQYGIEHTFSMPLLETIAANGDSGTPFVLEHPESSQAAIYKELAEAVVREVAKAKHAGSRRPQVEYREADHVLAVLDGDQETATMAPALLRSECRCAACVEEMTGRQILVKASIPATVKPLRMYPTGNYALSVDWSDGHRSLYPYRQIRSMLQQQTQRKETSKEKSKL